MRNLLSLVPSWLPPAPQHALQPNVTDSDELPLSLEAQSGPCGAERRRQEPDGHDQGEAAASRDSKCCPGCACFGELP